MATNKNLEISFVSSDTFRDIFQSSAEGILMVEETGIILLANPVSEKMFGYLPGAMVGQSIEMLIPSKYNEKHKKHRKKFVENPEPRRMGIGRDLTALRHDGTEFPVEVSLSYTKVSGQLLVMAFVSDISQRKVSEAALRKSEEQLMRYATDLERKVQARTESLNKVVNDLEKANEELQEQIRERQKAENEVRKSLEKEKELNEMKTKFVSIASHEFRTPLSTVLSSASLVKQYKDRGQLDQVDKHLTRIKSSVNHLTDILNEFLSLGRLDEGKVDVQSEELNVSDFLVEIRDELNTTLKPGQFIEVQLPPGPLIVTTDSRIMRNILFNLISNASKYSNPGSRINLLLESSENEYSITVEDEGIGIPKHELVHIFERFYRASNASNHQGTGLGLSIVKRYAELLGGKVTFASEYEKGSSFSVSIPI